MFLGRFLFILYLGWLLPELTLAANLVCGEEVFNEIALKRKGLAAPTTTTKPKNIAPHLEKNLEAVREKAVPKERPPSTLRELGRGFAAWVRPTLRAPAKRLSDELNRLGLLRFRGADRGEIGPAKLLAQTPKEEARSALGAPESIRGGPENSIAAKTDPEDLASRIRKEPEDVQRQLELRKADLAREEIQRHVSEIRASGAELRYLRRLAEREDTLANQKNLLDALRRQQEHAEGIRSTLLRQGDSNLKFEEIEEWKIARSVSAEVAALEKKVANLEEAAKNSSRGLSSAEPPARLTPRDIRYEKRKALVAEGRKLAASQRDPSTLSAKEAEALRAFKSSQDLMRRVATYRRNLASLPMIYQGQLAPSDVAMIAGRFKRLQEQKAVRSIDSARFTEKELQESVKACIR